MEESIWMVFGVIGMLIALGIIGPLLYNQTNTFSNSELEYEVKKITSQANFLCSTQPGNQVSVPISLYYNTTIYTKEDKVCIKGDEKISCQIINCQFSNYEFTLDSDIAKEFFKLDYDCSLQVGSSLGYLNLNCEG